MKKTKYTVLLIFFTLFLGVTAADSYVIEFKGDTALQVQQDHEQLIEKEFSDHEQLIEKEFSDHEILNNNVKTSQEALENRKKEIGSKQAIINEKISGNGDARISSNYTQLFAGVAVENISEDQIQQLEELDIVKNIEENRQVETQLETSREIVGAEDVWDQQIEDENITGEGVDIAVIDTGVDYTHESLGECEEPWEEGSCPKVPKGYDFVNQEEDPMDDDGHGTHVAGIAAANGDTKGIAPDSRIFAYKALDEEGSGFLTDVIDSIELAVEDGADVIILSLGSDGNPDDSISTAVDNAVNEGVTVVAAAGNEGENYSVGSPGTARNALTVGATTDEDDLAEFSSRGPVEWEDTSGNDNMILKPSLTAPGQGIESTQIGGGTTIKSGTSMSTPMAGGAAALLIQENNDWSPNRIKSILMNTANEIEGTGFEVGTGRLDLNNAFNNPRISTGQPIINFNEISSDSSSESLEIQNLYDEKLEIDLSAKNTKNMFNGKEYSVIDLETEKIELASGESENIDINVNRQAQEGTYHGSIIIRDNKSNFERTNSLSFNQLSSKAEFELKTPEDGSEVSGDTGFEFTIETDSDETGDVDLRLGDEVAETFNHEGGQETYTTTQLKDPGVYEWDVEYKEDSTVSEVREIEFEDTGMKMSDFQPENNTEVGFSERNIEFSTELDLEHETDAKLVINDEKIETERFEEGQHIFDIEEELDAGKYRWKIELESVNSDYTTESGERRLNISEPSLNTSLQNPENKSTFSIQEDIDFDFETETDEEANVRLNVNEEILEEKNVDKGTESVKFTESFDEVEEYDWFIEIEGLESGNTNKSEDRVFQTSNQFDIDLLKPDDDETFYWNDREIVFEAEVDSEEDADYKLYINDEVEEEKEILSEEKPETISFDYVPENTGEFEWYIEASSTESDVEEKTFSRNFEVKEITEFNLIEPETQESFQPGTEEVKFNYSVESQDAGEKKFKTEPELEEQQKKEQDEGLENYTQTITDLDAGVYEWYLEFESDSGNTFTSEASDFEIEETEIDVNKIEPEEDDNIGYLDREIEFQFDVSVNEDSIVYLKLDEETLNDWNIERNEEKSLDFTEELDPGEYSWEILVETEETDTSKTSEKTSFTIEDPKLDIENLSPEDGKEYVYNEEPEIHGDLFAEKEGTAEIEVNDTKKEFNFDEGENEFSETFDLESGLYYWNITLDTEENEKTTETRKFTLHPFTDADIELIEPENNQEFIDSEVSFQYSIDSNASGTATLDIENHENIVKDHEKGEEEYNKKKELDSGKTEWKVLFKDDKGREFESNTRTVETDTDIELELISPEDGEELNDENVDFEAEIDSSRNYDLTFYINNEEIQTLENQETSEFTTTESLEEGANSWRVEVENSRQEDQKSRDLIIDIEEEEDSEGTESSPPPEEEEPEEEEEHERQINKTIMEESAEISNIYSDEEAERKIFDLEAENYTLPIDQISLEIPEDTEDGLISIERISKDTELIKNEAFSLESSNIDVENYEIRFFVEKSWLDDNTLTKENIKIYSSDEEFNANKNSETDSLAYFKSNISDGEFMIASEEPEEGSAISELTEECRSFENRFMIPEDWEVVSSCETWEERKSLEEELNEISQNDEDEESSENYQEVESLIEEENFDLARSRIEDISEEQQEEEYNTMAYIAISIGLLVVLASLIAVLTHIVSKKREKEDKLVNELHEVSEYVSDQIAQNNNFHRRYKVVEYLEEANNAVEKGDIEKAAIPLKNAEKILKDEEKVEFN